MVSKMTVIGTVRLQHPRAFACRAVARGGRLCRLPCMVRARSVRPVRSVRPELRALHPASLGPTGRPTDRCRPTDRPLAGRLKDRPSVQSGRRTDRRFVAPTDVRLSVRPTGGLTD